MAAHTLLEREGFRFISRCMNLVVWLLDSHRQAAKKGLLAY